MRHLNHTLWGERTRGSWPAWAVMGVVAFAVLIGSLSAGAHASDAPLGMKSTFGLTQQMQSQPVHRPSYLTQAMDSAWSILIFEQHQLTQNMTGAVRNLKSSTNVAVGTSALVVASFIYGILHAAGPGHGKAVISSYMLADKETLRRGIFLAFLSSLIQALSAITLIGGLYVAAVATGMQTKWAEAWLETLSWGFVAAVGASLLFKQLWPMVARSRCARAVREHSTPDHSHHDRAHDYRLHAHDHGLGLDHEDHHEHDHPHHVHDEHCGHVHLPGPEELYGDLSWGRALAISFSIGIRPCTGALLVIIFAATQGLIWAGILATFAMAFGTALTVSALAAVSVGSRKLAIAIAGAESGWGQAVAKSTSILSSTAVFVLGTVFFFASFHDVRPF